MKRKVPTFPTYLTSEEDTPMHPNSQSTTSKKLEHSQHREEREIRKLERKTSDVTAKATLVKPGI